MDKQDPLHNTQKTNNPYFHGLKLIYKRLRWDIRFESWRSRRMLKEIKNIHRGEKAVILCNGPSLLETDFSKLDGIYTFGLNKINLLFDKYDFRPSSIVAVNRLVIEQNTKFFNSTKIDLFLSSHALGRVNNSKNTIFLHSTAHRMFSRDVAVSIYEGHTVTFVALQLAYHMGFKSVTLVGCDHNFQSSGPSNQEVIAEGSDVNHFDPNYFADGMKWHLPDLFESEIGYQMADKMFTACGRKIYNSTEGGNLDIFERLSLEEFRSL